MSRVTKPVLVGLAAVACAMIAISAILFFHGSGEGDQDVDGAALVTLAPVHTGPIDDVVLATGAVQADPGGQTTVAAPRAVIVRAVYVRPGEPVVKGQPLVRIGDLPTTALAFAQAKNALNAAQRDLTRIQTLAAQHLVGSDQVSLAERNLADAQAAWSAAKAQGAGDATVVLKAPAGGVVLTVPAVPGQRVADMAELVTLSGQTPSVAHLWVSPGDAAKLKVGDKVAMTAVFGGGAFTSTLSEVGRLVDPATKQIAVEAPLSGAGEPVGAALKARIVAGSHQGFSVPAGAVVYDETGAHLFVIAKGKASRVNVRPGPQVGDEVEVSGPIQAGQLVALTGAYQLQDGMDVRVGR